MAFPSNGLLRSIPIAALLLAMAAAPGADPLQAQAQEQGLPRSPGAKPAPTLPDPALEGMPLYSSDGKQVGTVITMGLDEENKLVLVAEIERQLGFGPTAIAVPTDMFVRKADRIELTLTEAEVNARLKE